MLSKRQSVGARLAATDIKRSVSSEGELVCSPGVARTSVRWPPLRTTLQLRLSRGLAADTHMLTASNRHTLSTMHGAMLRVSDTEQCTHAAMLHGSV